MISLEKLLKKHIVLDIKVDTKKEVIHELLYKLARTENINHPEKLLNEILNREELSTTGLGFGIAVPHIRTDIIDTPLMFAIRTKNEIDFNSIDGIPVRLFFLFLIPNNKPRVGMEILSKITGILRNEKMREKLLTAKNEKEFLSVFVALDLKEE